MINDYLIVDKDVLPDVYAKVVEVKRMIEQGEDVQVSDAVRRVGLSRSTFYKYKDHVFQYSTDLKERKAVLSFMLNHEKGLLTEALNIITQCNCNILTINQSIPIRQRANVTLSIDISDMEATIEELMERLQAVKGINRVTLIALE